MTPTNPLSSLDVEACVRLLTASELDWRSRAAWHTYFAQPADADACLVKAALASALASALPGMGKPFTYHAQPGNEDAWSMGEACSKASQALAGDYIDRGLVLLRELEAKGFGVVRVSSAARAAQPRETSADAE